MELSYNSAIRVFRLSHWFSFLGYDTLLWQVCLLTFQRDWMSSSSRWNDSKPFPDIRGSHWIFSMDNTTSLYNSGAIFLYNSYNNWHTYIEGQNLIPLSTEISILFFQPSFHFCFHILISFWLPDVTSVLETDEATSANSQIYNWW
jgi:hypothetical protein